MFSIRQKKKIKNILMKTFITIILLILSLPSFAAIWKVGPSKTYKYCSQVAPLVQHGDTIAIDYATYKNDPQVIWNKNDLYIVGVGGRPRLEAGSIIANDQVNGKGIFVISGANVRIDNIEFANAAVVDHNGAGIRQEGSNLLVHRCKFDGNEMGILCGAIPDCTITVEYSEFLNGGSSQNPGYQHNIYIGHIDTLIFRYNFSYNAVAQGHEFKSRADYNFILYNTIANYETIDSRNIDLPNGGTAVIMGNVIEQGQNSANSNILGYGKEGLTNSAQHNIWIVNNTFVNKKTTGSFVDVNSETNKIFLKNNILAGAKTGGLIIGATSNIDSSNNIVTDIIADCGFLDPENNNYHLSEQSEAVDAGLDIDISVGEYQLIPDKMYKDTCNFENRSIYHSIDIGAFEFNDSLSSAGSTELFVFSFYPNPANNYITIVSSSWEQMKTVQICNLQGFVVKEQWLPHIGNMDISDLPEGYYFIRFKEFPANFKKFIVVR
ncbi:MAG TPA: hypothetical protein DCX89_00515 [Saprospirales bacterium]|nr:hypothetical protein [Saprospirales bacterium]